jgi:hypothetical protein
LGFNLLVKLVIAETNRQFDQQIKAQYLETQEELSHIYRNLRKLAVDAESKRELAEEWLYAAEQYCDFIKQFYHYEQFTPGRVEWLERQLDQTRQNLEVGLSEAAIASSQQLYLVFSELRVELERLQNEWNLLYQAAWEAVNRVLNQMDECQVIQAIDLEGNLIDQQINLEYWSEGRFNALYESANSIREEMCFSDTPLDRETLRSWLEDVIPGCQKELEDLVVAGRISVINSQLRINIADLVVQALQEQGFILAQAEYADQDMRMSFGARMLNMEGNQVIIQVAPTGEKLGENELHLQSMDSEQRTEHELEQRWYEISRSLNHFGVEVGQYTRLDQDRPRKTTQPATPGLLAKNKNQKPQMRSGHGYRTNPPDHQDG